MFDIIGKTATGLGFILLTIVTILIVEYVLRNTVGRFFKRIHVSDSFKAIVAFVLFALVILAGSYIVGEEIISKGLIVVTVK